MSLSEDKTLKISRNTEELRKKNSQQYEKWFLFLLFLCICKQIQQPSAGLWAGLNETKLQFVTIFPKDACKSCFSHSSCSGESPAQEVAYQLLKCTVFLADKFMFLQFLWDFDLLQVIYNQALKNYGQFRWKTDIFQLISAFFLNAPCFQSMKKY